MGLSMYLWGLVACVRLVSPTPDTFWLVRSSDPVRGVHFLQPVLTERIAQQRWPWRVRIVDYGGEPVLRLEGRAGEPERLTLLLQPLQLHIKVREASGWLPLPFRKADLEQVSISEGYPLALRLRFTPEATTRFARVSEQYVGETLGIFLDDKLLAAPVIQEPITGGEASIHGQFSRGELELLVQQLRQPPLPRGLVPMVRGEIPGS